MAKAQCRSRNIPNRGISGTPDPTRPPTVPLPGRPDEDAGNGLVMDQGLFEEDLMDMAPNPAVA